MKIERYFLLVLIISLSSINSLSQEITLSADSLLTLDGKLDSIYRNLPEVMIVGERPVVKAQKGKLIYDLPRIIQDKPVDNIYDAIKELPGVTEMNGGIQLAGRPVSVVIDGKVNTMSADQLTSFLKSMPSGRIANAEVMYNAPARYQVRGAMINITLKHSSKGERALQGEIYGKAKIQHYEGFSERASVVYNHDRLSMDFLYSHNHGRNYTVTEKEAKHRLNDGSIHSLTTSEYKNKRGHTHSFRFGTDFNFSEKNMLSFVYNGSYSSTFAHMSTKGSQQAYNLINSRDWMHNLRADYSTPWGISAGVEMTYYNAPSNQNLSSSMNNESLNFTTKENQRINRWKFFLSREQQLKSGLGVNYGIIYNTSIDNSYQLYKDKSSSSSLNDMKSRKKEHTLNMYAGFNKSFGQRFSMDASLAVEYYKSEIWNQWDLYPTINLSYLPSDGHILQFSISSDKSYPDYWAVQNSISFLGGGYSEIHGNPYLKPSQDYEAKLTYILKNKYIFSTWFNHSRNYSTQTLYQSSKKLVEIYKYVNFDYQQQVGIQASIPVKSLKWINSRLTLIGVWHHEKDGDFWDIPFDRNIVYGMAVMNNTIKFPSISYLSLIINGMIRSRAIQGIYDLPSSGNFSMALRYSFAKGKGIVSLYGNDIFETSQISPIIKYKTQNVRNRYSCFREVGLGFTYKFGGYKEKKRKEVDTSRFK